MKEEIKSFDFEIRTHVIFGEGRIKELADILESEFCSSVAVIVDSAVKSNEDIQESIKNIEDKNISVSVFYNDVAEPDYGYLDEFKKQMISKDFDYVVGIGGGSTIDLAKGMATLLTNEGPSISYRGFPELKNKPLPVIAIPTTGGTGSDVTFNAVFTDNNEKRKLGINSKHNYPVHAILDPKLTVSCPDSVTVSAGMDALVHTLESFGAKNSTYYSRIFSKEAFKLLFNNLISVLDNPSDISIRGNILLGSHYAGAALMNSGAGPSGAMTYPLGGIHKVPHGIAGGMILPKIIRLNVEKGYLGYHELYDLIEGADFSLSKEEKSRAFAERIEQLCNKLDVPVNFDKFGIKKDDVSIFMEQLYGMLKGAMDLNPIEVKEEEMKNILESMF
ncbi:iron-containing alcohol dehydrogenase [Candidatus Woesearchaeota archaeon]|nr:iron-containing alcohol dehydrogenase [Candidatus Woesearchaeota archaeon]